MKLLIIGASGLLGINLALETMREHEVIGIDRGKLQSAPFPVRKANFFQRRVFDPMLDATQPDWVINCAALANLEECEKHPGQARILNTELPRELADACARRKIKFVHLSTDAVFDGTREDAYTEDVFSSSGLTAAQGSSAPCSGASPTGWSAKRSARS